MHAELVPDGSLRLFLRPRKSALARVKDWALYMAAQILFSLAWGGATPFPPHPWLNGARRALGRAGVFLASFSDYLENKVLDHVFGDGAYTSPTAYVALCTAVPTDASTGTTIVEATYTGYARLIINAADMSAAASGSKTNSAALTFAACTAGASTIIGFAVCDALTVGNVLAWGTITSKVIDTSNTPATIQAGALVCTLD